MKNLSDFAVPSLSHAWTIAVAMACAVAASRGAAADDGEWILLFDGATLNGWSVVDFAGGAGASVVEDGVLQVDAGAGLSGVVYTGEVPTMDFEVALEARRVAGGDFFCGLTVPVGETHCTLIVGGWGGVVFGISSIDGMDASENEACHIMEFENGRWYAIRFRVTEGRLQAWLDGKKLIDENVMGRRIGLRPGGIARAKPLSLTTYGTTGQFREVRIRAIDPGGDLFGD